MLSKSSKIRPIFRLHILNVPLMFCQQLMDEWNLLSLRITSSWCPKFLSCSKWTNSRRYYQCSEWLSWTVEERWWLFLQYNTKVDRRELFFPGGLQEFWCWFCLTCHLSCPCILGSLWPCKWIMSQRLVYTYWRSVTWGWHSTQDKAESCRHLNPSWTLQNFDRYILVSQISAFYYIFV